MKEIELQEKSNRNAATLKKIFNLEEAPPITGDPILELSGLIKDYSDEKTDSVEVLRQIREESAVGVVELQRPHGGEESRG